MGRGVKVIHLHPGADTAGQSFAGKAVLEEGPDFVRVFARSQHSFGYGRVEPWDDEEIRAAIDWADTIVIHNDPLIWGRFADGRERNLIVHHHGSRFRSHPEVIAEQAADIGARQVVSTLDLLLSVPPGHSAEWLPQVVDVERMERVREVNLPPEDSRPRVAHAPTNKSIKGTRWVIRAMRHVNADFDLIVREPWWICLRRKAMATVFVDQLNLGYGNNAIEAWAMHLPVLASASAPILELMRKEFGGLPFYLTSTSALRWDLKALVADPDLREKWAEIGYQHVLRYHAPEAWAKRVRAIYAGEPLALAA